MADDKYTHRIKTSRHVCHHDRRLDRRDRAIERQADRDSITDADQLRRLDDRPGNSTRERVRLG